MNTPIKLPVYSNEALASMTATELLEAIIHNEDRVPRNIIDECAQRGQAMVDALTPWADANEEREEENSGHWWLRLHAIMILGLIPTEQAGNLLLNNIRTLSQTENKNLEDWLAGYWPALMQNKPTSTIAQLRNLCMNKEIHWYIRTNITDAVIADAARQSEKKLEQSLDWAMQLVTDKNDDWNYRLCTADTLLDFPRERYRELLYNLADKQDKFGAHFNKDDIDNVYAENKDQPEWTRFSDPWLFYDKQKIENRQQRWQKEALESDTTETFNETFSSQFDYQHEIPYHRETQKTGRNDPCHCGSGKKYKKCCLNKEQITLH